MHFARRPVYLSVTPPNPTNVQQHGGRLAAACLSDLLRFHELIFFSDSVQATGVFRGLRGLIHYEELSGAQLGA